MDPTIITIQKAGDLVKDHLPDWYEENRAYAQEGDHWQEGKGWIGPPASSPGEFTAEVKKQIQTQFTPRDAIGEILDRVENGLLKTEPTISLMRRDGRELKEGQEDQKADAGINLLSLWWDEAKFHEKLKLATRIARWAGHAYLRPWVPPYQMETAKDDEDQDILVVPSGPLDESLMRISVQVAEPNMATIYTDPDTEERVSVFMFERDGRKHAELSWVDENGLTQVRVIGENKDLDAEEYEYDLGGRLMLVELRADVLITESVRRQQKRLNFFESVLTRNVETGGFPERVITNAEPEGMLVPRQPGQKPGLYPTKIIDGVVYELRPLPRTLGSGVTSEVQGIKYTDAAGNQQITEPGVHRFDPIDPMLTISAARHAYQVLLEEAKQGHILITGDAAASGVSRQQARGDFEDDLSNTKSAVEGATRDTLELVLALAEEFSSGSESYLTDYRVIADLFVNSGPITPEDARSTAELRKEGLLSLETAMMRAAGVEDIAAEMAKMEQEEGGQLAINIKRAEMTKILTDAGLPVDRAMAIAGFDEEDIQKVGTAVSNIQQ